MLGGVVVALNTWWRRREMEHALAISDTELLITVDRYISNDYTAILSDIGDLATAFPKLKQIVCLGENMPACAMTYADMAAKGKDVPDETVLSAARAVQPDDLAMLLFTSGSTSRSKAAELRHFGLIGNMWGIGERMHLTEQDRILLVIPCSGASPMPTRCSPA